MKEPERKEPPAQAEPLEPTTQSAPSTRFAALWSPDDATRTFTPGSTGQPVDLPFLFSSNQRFGPYVIVRPLGKGGMGQVYEADEIESGRRVAVKILSRGIGEEEELERFLREGQLAASLSHPNCVYVFGTSEVQGFPVIAMELVPEGTLKDRVAGAPMSMAAAVDAILQVITGLDAAASIGILHRDVKPSNCFVHRDGRVLVGDFGLSVSASAHAPGERATGTILGTPGFASPEQLRGDALDVRSDIYSVGATLFYLLTGRAPFDDRSTTALIAKVAAEAPPALDLLRPELPHRLAQIVARCLSKDRKDRFDNYRALRIALEPFGSSRVVPAPLWRRFLAGAVDDYLTSLPALAVVLFGSLQPLSPSHPLHALALAITLVTSRLIYYGLLEGVLGAGVGKAMMGLRVVNTEQVTPGVPRAALRALLFAAASQAIVQAITWSVVRRVPDVAVGFLNTVTTVAYLIALFCTARPLNGWAALHDRWSRTRVVRRRVRVEARASATVQATEAVAIAGDVRVGPYVLPSGTEAHVEMPHLVMGYDDRLRRRVWVHLLPAGSPSLGALRRDLDRPARTRWLAGGRAPAESWDAYEAIDGRPLRDVASAPQRWSKVRHWLDDLARELTAGLADGSLPRLHPDRVWIGRDDRARLVEWTNAGAGPIVEPPESDDPTLPSVQHLLYATAVAALLGITPDGARKVEPSTPLPRAARDVLLKLRDAKFTSSDALLEALGTALTSPTHLSRIRRAGQIAVSAAVPVLITAITVAAELRGSVKQTTTSRGLFLVAFAVYVGTFVIPMFFSAIGALVTGSGFTFRPFGATLVNKRGKRASRVRALWRAIATWIPVVITLVLFAAEPRPPDYRWSIVAVQCLLMIAMTAAAVWAILNPSRSIQDRLSGTWIVPR
ncbi:MAG TPA: protein kinase [Vicinamibacterales bacterium]|nr:protein kinase [Vicinamibacterales bacterium]